VFNEENSNKRAELVWKRGGTHLSVFGNFFLEGFVVLPNPLFHGVESLHIGGAHFDFVLGLSGGFHKIFKVNETLDEETRESFLLNHGGSFLMQFDQFFKVFLQQNRKKQNSCQLGKKQKEKGKEGCTPV
jgi:hypothetical protein